MDGGFSSEESIGEDEQKMAALCSEGVNSCEDPPPIPLTRPSGSRNGVDTRLE